MTLRLAVRAALNLRRYSGSASESTTRVQQMPSAVSVGAVEGVADRGILSAIGNTPLLKLRRLSDETGCTILGKAEFMNPGGSVKDRAALFLVQDAVEKGLLRPGGTVVEGTAGNTGIGLAHVCRAMGYNCVIYMPNTQSQEKIDLLRSLGADVRAVPAVPFTDPLNYNHQAREFAAATPNAYWCNQFDNVANRLAHYMTTGPEIWDQTQGRLDAFTCSTGTGGTLAGVTKFLKSVSASRVKSYLADPPGSVLYNLKTNGVLERMGTGSITEGIGQGRLTENLKEEFDAIDGAVYVTDEETIEMVYRLLDEEGLFVGASSALNIVAAVKVSELTGKGSTVVTIICDGAHRYQSRLFSKAWLESKNLLSAVPERLHHYILP